jgi:Tol biopolymer transport system component
MPSSLYNAKSYTPYVKVLLPIALFVLSVSSSFAKDLTADMPRLICINESFRFPEKDLLHPSLSPNEKWLVYRKVSIFSKMGNLISYFLDTTYKKMYYSRIDKNEKIALPLPQKKLNDVGYRIEWSQDGRFLALSAQIDDNRSIILIEFSGSKPRLVEYFEAEEIFHWTIENVLLYSHSSGNIMKKVPGMDPGKAVSLGKGERAYDFQLADNGTVLFILGSSPSWKVYKTNLQNPEHRTLIFESEMTPEFIISGDGQFALVSTRKLEKPDYWSTQLYDLNTNVINLELATHIRNARFSPDGSKLAFKEVYDPSKYTFKEGYNPSKHRIIKPHFFVLDLKTKHAHDYGYGIDEHFNWTPDGNHIIFSMKCIHESGVYEHGIFVVRISDGKEVAKLTSISSIPAPTMSRSGKYIIWQGSDRWEGPVHTFFVVRNPLDSNLFSAAK